MATTDAPEQTIEIQTPAPVSFRIPTSWEIDHDVAEVFSLKRQPVLRQLIVSCVSEGRLAGEIVMISADTSVMPSPVALAQRLIAHARLQGLQMGGATLQQVPASEGMDALHYIHPKSNFAEQPMDTPILVIEAGEIKIGILLISPSHEVSPAWSAYNRTTFEFIVQSFRFPKHAMEKNEPPSSPKT